MPPTRPGASIAAAILVILLVHPRPALSDELDELIFRVESAVLAIAEAAVVAFSDRASAATGCQCSPHACGSDFGESHVCHEEMGGAGACGSCVGRKLDFNKSFVLTPPDTDVDKLDPSVKDSVCTFKALDEIFAGANADYDIQVQGWAYIATTDGVMRTWPGHARNRGDDVDENYADEKLGGCKIYDPRTRPWYTAATSGPKDVVLLIDTSRSMLEPDNPFVEDSPTRWDNAKDALLRLLDTFSHTDYINMVDFSDKADSLIPGGMVQATTANIERVKEAVRRVRPLGGTDFRRGLNKAFNLLTKASKTLGEEDVRTSNCQKVVIFLTDGQDCATTGQNCSMETPEGFSPVDAVLEFIDKQQQQLVEAGSERAHVFPISFGLDADDEIPKEIACANEGVWGRILSDDDPLVVLNAYTSYLASKRRDAGIVWTRQYEDEFGLGSVVTATKPIYSWPTSAGEFGALIGVVAHDVRIEDARALIPEGQSVVDRLVSRDAECVEADFSGCELQLLRGRAAECPETFMDSMCYYFDKTDSFYIAPQSPLLDFAEAQVYCESLGGSLAEIDEPDEEDLLSGLAPNSGSWIGLVRDEDFVWRWQSTGEEVSPASKVWTFMRELNDVGRACGRLDRRGVRHSVHPEDCDAQARFICEFTAEAEPHVCRRDSDLIRVDKDYRYSVRPLSTCKMEDEAFKAIRVATPEASSLPENRVICPLGEPSTTVDVQCCEGCTP